MKILCISDNEQRELWEHWDTSGRRLLEGVELILSAGDLQPQYLEFLVTMSGVPCLYVRGNHDGYYDVRPPQGCVCIEDCIAEIYEDPQNGRTDIITGPERFRGGTAWIRCLRGLRRLLDIDRSSFPGSTAPDNNSGRIIRIAGLGGSMRYREGPDMYTEKEMAGRVRRLLRKNSSDIDILLTHAPCYGYGDMDDLPHRGFVCFHELIDQTHPAYHCYGHVHMEYGRIERETDHPSGTRLINVSGMYILEI